MAEAQPFTAVSSGGLALSTSPYELLRTPNVAIELINFEVSNDGGYRRINGFESLGLTSATKPEGANIILGVTPYGEGAVVCVATNVYYTEDGVTWLQINKDTGVGGLLESAMPAASALTRIV